MPTPTQGDYQRLDIFTNQDSDKCYISAEYTNVDGYAQFKPDDKFNRALVKLAKEFPDIKKIEFISSATSKEEYSAKHEYIGNNAYIRLVWCKQNKRARDQYTTWVHIKKYDSLHECFTQGPSDAITFLSNNQGKQIIQNLLNTQTSKQQQKSRQPETQYKSSTSSTFTLTINQMSSIQIKADNQEVPIPRRPGFSGGKAWLIENEDHTFTLILKYHIYQKPAKILIESNGKLHHIPKQPGFPAVALRLSENQYD